MMQFEGEYYNLPENFDEYLTKIYGDYKKIPDVEDQYSHGDIIIDLKKDFSYYMNNYEIRIM